MGKYDNLIPISRLSIKRKENKKMMSTILVPSASHSYALAVEYVQKWFLSKFSKDYFKTVYIEGKHIFDESRKFTIDKTARRQNPAVAIIPTIDFSFDRETLDLSMGGLEIHQEKSTMDTCFFRDYKNGLFIKEVDQVNLLNFTIRVYVDTRAKQLNLWHYMKLAFRVGASQGEYIDIDFSIPQEIMLQLALDNNFEVDLEKGKIKNVVEFLNYLNRNSLVPFLYKLRCENGRDEFFVRATGQYIHIAIPDALSVEDGDRVGHVYENFPIEMNLSLRFPSPQSFLYMSKKPQTIIEGIKMEKSEDVVGLYSIKIMDIPTTNEKDWGIYIQTEYLEDKPTNELSIEISELFDHTLREVLNYTMDQFLSPNLFVDIKLYDTNQILIPYDIDWKTLTIKTTDNSRKYQKIIFAIYVDNKYLNDTVVTMNNSANERFNRSQTQ